MVKNIARLMVVAFCLFLAISVSAAELQLYVKNRPFKGAVVTQNGQINAELGSLISALGFSWTVDGNTVDISRYSGVGGPQLEGNAYTLMCGKKNINVAVEVINGKPFVSVPAFAKALDLRYSTSKALGTADLIVPVAKADVSGAWGNASAAKEEPAENKAADKKAKKEVKLNAQGQIETDGSNPDSPIQVLDIPYMDTTTPGSPTAFIGEVRTSCVFANAGSDDLHNVKVTLSLCNFAGEVVTSWSKTVGDLKAGQTVTFVPDPPVWYNYNMINTEPKVLICHDPIEEEEEAKAPSEATEATEETPAP